VKIQLAALSICLAVAASPLTASSEEVNNWEFDLAPFYFWAINIDGDLTVRGRVASASVDFGDIWDNLEGVFTTRFIAVYRKKFGLLVDYNYLDIGKEPLSRVTASQVGFESHVLNIAITYRLMDGKHTLDGAAGARYVKLDSEFDFRNRGITLQGDQDWTDPIVGLRYSYAFSDKWTLRMYGDIGGFGVSSNFTWQGLAMIDFQPWKNVSIVAGYRGIGTDYETGGIEEFEYDTTIHGPIFGLDIRW
jgi:hypothetical protein